MSTGGVGDGGKGAEHPSEQGAPRATTQGVGDRPRRRRGAESVVVPDADFQSYYGRQVIHTPVWEVPQVPGYLYLGGMSGAASVMGALADATGRPALAKVGRLAASGGSVVSVVLLIDDLGVPTRFLNMLRVVKWTSPLSVGSWILMPFSTGAGLAAVHELSGVVLPLVRKVAGQRLGHLAEVVLPVAGRLGGVGSALFGPPLATYTAVLIADTAVPAWHSVYPELPFVFAASGAASAGGIGMVAAPVGEAGPARRMGALGAVAELALSRRMEHRIGMIGEAYRTGRAGVLLRLSRVAMAGGAAGALASDLPVWPRTARAQRARRVVSVVGGALLNAGAALTRFGVYEAGMISARDPKYTVVPQRERLDARREGREPDPHLAPETAP
ncbi:NrfD/PsrC family molybdoenzyme membrane anchor subunit [Quadrisphaera setariae]|uniref:Polysulphide reductase, NrfD n=1 Tax=Quadrisphaera setariae TaxID=2593304 RepID=A0A5C8ZGL4_9ACTN|nr:NrfD/PsrC family molybdoenzyme membrane anchor subunit [Quadrisphaera setariae]TXR56714.1 hypothetical protein FMM08_08180 [Quadrisphaera setariae]